MCRYLMGSSDFHLTCRILVHHYRIAVSAVFVFNLPAASWRKRKSFSLFFSFTVCILGPNPQLVRARLVMDLKACYCSANKRTSGQIYWSASKWRHSSIDSLQMFGGSVHFSTEGRSPDQILNSLHLNSLTDVAKEILKCVALIHALAAALYCATPARHFLPLSCLSLYILSHPFSIKTLPPTASLPSPRSSVPLSLYWISIFSEAVHGVNYATPCFHCTSY